MFIDLNEENNRNDYFENNQVVFSSPNISYQDYFYRVFYDKSNLNDNIENRCIYETFNDNKYDAYMTQFQDEKTTAYKSKKTIKNKNYNHNYEPLKILDNVKIKADSLPIFYSFDDIKNKIFENDEYKNKFMFEIDNIFIKDKKSEEPYLNKKRLREYDYNDNYIYDFIEQEKSKNYLKENQMKRGRKSTKEENRGEHNRMWADNIIKKVKAELFKYIALFLNNIINESNSEGNNIIYKLDYRFINQLNREIDLKYLNMPLKDLFSLDISPKYRKLNPETNKINIERILNENPDETIQFAFSMTFRDWLDIFSYKKKVKELLNEYNIDDYSNDICSKIEKNLVYVDDLFNTLAKNDNKYYFSNFTFYLYNYEIWFFNKKGRKSKKKNKSSDFSFKFFN